MMHLKALRSKATPPAGRQRCSPMGCVVCGCQERSGGHLCLLQVGSGEARLPRLAGSLPRPTALQLLRINQREINEMLVADEGQLANGLLSRGRHGHSMITDHGPALALASDPARFCPNVCPPSSGQSRRPSPAPLGRGQHRAAAQRRAGSALRLIHGLGCRRAPSRVSRCPGGG